MHGSLNFYCRKVWVGLMRIAIGAGIYYSMRVESFVRLDETQLVQPEWYQSQSGISKKIDFCLELDALIQVIGPQGVQFLDGRICQWTVYIASSIKEYIQANIDSLDKFRNGWMDDSKVSDLVRKIKSTRILLISRFKRYYTQDSYFRIYSKV